MLGTQELGEADLIVTLLTEHLGQVRAVAPAARRSRRRFGGLLEPLTRVQASWSEREGRELHRLEEVLGRRSFAEMQSEPVRQAACAVLAEVATGFSREGQPEAAMFRLLAAALDALESGVTPWVVLRYYEYWTLRIHGLLPDLSCCAACATPLPARGVLRIGARRGPLCRRCPAAAHEREAELTSGERAFLEELREHPPREVREPAGEVAGSAGLELLLRGALESFVERRFHTYRHFKLAALPPIAEPRP